MSTEPQPDPNQPKVKQIHLQQVARQFMTGLQRHFDTLAFNIAARDTVTEEAYDRQSALPKIMPVAPAHQNFEQMQAFTQDLLVRQVVGDTLNLAVTALNHSHFFLALIKSCNAGGNPTEAEQKVAHEAQKDFLPAQLDEKFNRLEKEFDVMCELEDSVTSLGFILQALMQQKGQVRAAQIDDAGELVLELKTIEMTKPENTESSPAGRLTNSRKVFREGDFIHFSSSELQLILVMIASFADSLFKSVALYARACKEGS
jgi:hypothetical protein